MSTDATNAKDSIDQPWTVGRLLTWTTEYLAKCGSLSPRLDAEVLLAHARQCERIMLYTAFTEDPGDETRTAFRELVRRRAEGTPVAYLVGFKEFYSLSFEVNPDVLIPRPETEFLVITVLDLAREQAGPLRIAEIGTGSGAVAVCLARELPEAEVAATDISPAALRVALRNAERHSVADRIEFFECDLLQSLPDGADFDFIASNPPYISAAEMEQLPRDIKAHEPQVALAGGPQGAELTLRLIEQAIPRLRSGGAIALETSPMLAAQIQSHLSSQADMAAAQVTQDLSGLARIVAARKLS